MEVLTYAHNNSLLTVDTKSSMDHPDCVDDDFDVQVAHMERMKSEQHRKDTYTTWPPSVSQRPAELARAGLFYTQKDDRVQCAFCHGVLKNWLPNDDPFSEHARHFPQCRFVRGYQHGNVPISPQPINAIPHNFNNYVAQLPAAINIVPPFSTNVATPREMRIFPVNTTLFQNPTSASFDLTKEDNRITTFRMWPQHLQQRPEVLARAGFYHIPCEEKPDRVKCAYCNGKLFNWQPEDDPFMEHAKCFPNCPYMAMCLGDDVIRDLQNPPQSTTSQNTAQPRSIQYEPQPSPSQTPARTSGPPTPRCDTLEVRMRSEPVQAVLEMGFRDDLVKQTVETCLHERQGNFPLAEELASLVMQLEDREQATTTAAAAKPLTPLQRMVAKTTSGATRNTSVPNQDQIWRQYRDPAVNTARIRDENSRMRDQYLCKVCMENQVRVTFMPCGHLACCGPCSMTMSECPICRTHISGCVRTYF